MQALLKLAFDAGINEVLAEILPDNLASARVVQKNGFIDTGRHIDDAGDLVVLWLARVC